MVTLLFAIGGVLLIAIVGSVLLNPNEERDEERARLIEDIAWSFF